jgi:hypothetical protein
MICDHHNFSFQLPTFLLIGAFDIPHLENLAATYFTHDFAALNR